MFQLAGCAQGFGGRRDWKGDLGDRLGRALIAKLSRLEFILQARGGCCRMLRRRGMRYKKKQGHANNEVEGLVKGRPPTGTMSCLFS